MTTEIFKGKNFDEVQAKVEEIAENYSIVDLEYFLNDDATVGAKISYKPMDLIDDSFFDVDEYKNAIEVIKKYAPEEYEKLDIEETEIFSGKDLTELQERIDKFTEEHRVIDTEYDLKNGVLQVKIRYLKIKE